MGGDRLGNIVEPGGVPKTLEKALLCPFCGCQFPPFCQDDGPRAQRKDHQDDQYDFGDPAGLKKEFEYFHGRIVPNPADPNYADCIVYGLAVVSREPLLPRGGDFGANDLVSGRNAPETLWPPGTGRTVDRRWVVSYKTRTWSAQVAQSVEQRTENPRVRGSIPRLGTTDNE